MNDACTVFALFAVIAPVFFVARDGRVGSLLFAWVGATVGGSIALVSFYEPAADRVGIEYILPLAMVGAMCGYRAGVYVQSIIVRSSPRRRALIELANVSLLCSCAGTLWGWSAGNKRESNPPIEMLKGAVIGALIGALAGLIQWRWSRRIETKPRAEDAIATPQADERNPPA